MKKLQQYVLLLMQDNMKKLEKLDIFISRMKKLGINIKIGSNFPWLYVDYINDKRVTEKFYAEHGFTIGFYPVKTDMTFEFLDISELFKLIRKYIND